MLGAGSLITRVYFPRLIVPLASVGVALVDLVVALLLLVPLMLWYGIVPGGSLLAVPLMIVVALVVALGVGIAFAAVSVVFRDFRHIEPFIVQIWMFATPVIYPASMIPEQWRWLAWLNPMSGVVEGFRACWRACRWTGPGVAASLWLGIVCSGRRRPVFRARRASFRRPHLGAPMIDGNCPRLGGIVA